MATATTLGRPAEQSNLSYHHLRRPSTPSGSLQAYSAEGPGYSTAATAATTAAMDHPPRTSAPQAQAPRSQGRRHLEDVGARGIKRGVEAVEADEGRRDDYPGYSTYSRGSSRSAALPSSASLSSYSAMPPMRTQLPSFDSFSSAGKSASDDFMLKRPRDSYTMDSSTRSSSFHSPRTTSTLDVNQADHEQHHYYHHHHQHQRCTFPPRGSSLLPRARNHDDVQPDAPPRDASPHQPSPTLERPASASTSHSSQHHNQHQQQQQQESQYHRQRQHYDSMHAPDEAAYSTSSSFDGSMPLAMRRGDAAHAKASKLHIDVPTTAAAPTSASTPVYDSHRGTSGSQASAPRASELPSHASLPQLSQRAPDAGPVSRSAPPTRVAFLDRGEGAGGPIDPRVEGSRVPESRYSRHHHQHQQQQHQHRQPPGYSPHARSNASDLPGSADSNDGAVAVAGHISPRLQSPPGVEARAYGSSSASGPSQTAYQHASSSRGPVLTPMSSRFVPQTATLPSPAYHTTRLVGGGVSPNDHLSHGRPSGSASAAAAAVGSESVPLPSSNTSPSPIAHSLASKAQFLSLFSSFYDSLSDSRTLKLTLEDQVRRSNALLQTLQKSTRVLEATVERKVAEERAGWEVRLGRLEEEVRSLTAKLAGEQQTLEVGGAAEEEEDEVEIEAEAEEAARVPLAPGAEEAVSVEQVLAQKRSPSSASASAASGSRPPSVAVAVAMEKVES